MTTTQNDHAGLKIEIMTLAETPRDRLDAEAMAIYQIFGQREAEFGFGANVVIEYPPIADPADSPFLGDPIGHIAGRLERLDPDGRIGRVVVLTTFGQRLLGPMTAAGYRADQIDMPAGPDHTYAFTLDRDAGAARTLYLEAVDEADEKIRPGFVIKLTDADGRLCGGACGSIHDRDGRRFAYLAMMTLVPGMPAGTGTMLAGALFAALRQQGVATVHLGTQTAGRFYEKIGFDVTHRLVRHLRTRVAADGRQIDDDLVMLRMDL